MKTSGEKIESSTMLYIFEMFGKSVTQILQQSVSQQAEIDELRGQIRSFQVHITNTSQALEEIEDRVLARLAEARPTVYTRDGIPLNDTLDLIQKGMARLSEQSLAHDQALLRVRDELKDKPDAGDFAESNQKSSEAAEGFVEISNTVQMIQKELVKQRNESDAVVDRCVQIVKLQIEQYNTRRGADNDLDGEDYITRKELELLLQSRALTGATVEIDDGDLEGSLARLIRTSSDLDAAYERKRHDLAQKLEQVRSMLGDGIDAGSDFVVEFDDTEQRDFVDVSVGRDGTALENGGEPWNLSTVPFMMRNIAAAYRIDFVELGHDATIVIDFTIRSTT
jgi:hypothetical protein